MSSAISTYNGPRSAKERAAIAWGADHGDRLHEQEQARHERLIAATRRIDPKPDASHEYAAVDARVRGRYWRRREHEHHNDLRRDGCTMCKGTGEITVSDGFGGMDFDACPKCQRAYGVAYGAGSVENF